jgi:MFS family permease
LAKKTIELKNAHLNRVIRWYDYITINIYWLGLTTLSQTCGLVFPLLIQGFVGEEAKATYYGSMRLWTLMVALLVQAMMGMLSDRSRLRWGRRRPFIFAGTLGDLVFISAIGFLAGVEGMTGYWMLFVFAIFLQITSNTAHSAEQGLIPDVVPEDHRGRFSGIKAVFEVPIPLILVSFTIGKLISTGHLWAGLFLAMGIITLVMLLTMLVREEPLKETPPPLDWTPFLRLVGMTALFTLIILGVGKAVELASKLLVDVTSATALFVIMGILGLAAMATAVALGVYLSVRVSVGDAAKENPSFTWWVVNRLAFLVGTTNLSGFAVYFFQGRLGYVREQAAGPAAQLMMFVGIFILVSALPSGWLADRFGHKRMVMLSGLVAALGTVFAVATTSLPVIYVGGCIIGIATGLFFTSNWALGTSLVPKGEAGRYLGLSNLAGAGAGAVGGYIGGPIADFFTAKFPEIPGLGYVLLFTMYGVMFLLSVVALAGVHLKASSEN